MKKIILLISIIFLPVLAQAKQEFNLPTSVDIPDLIEKVAELLSNIAIPLGVVFLIVAAFKFIMARGDQNKIKEAQVMVLWILIGVAVAFFAPALVDMVLDLVGVGPQAMPD